MRHQGGQGTAMAVGSGGLNFLAYGTGNSKLNTQSSSGYVIYLGNVETCTFSYVFQVG